MRLVTFLFIFLYSIVVTADTSTKLIIPLKISVSTLTAEVAHTQMLRARGLMNRTSLEENSGMLFIFPEAGYYSMWMLNTNIPLSVAFLDEKGVILNLADMIPHTRTTHNSAGLAKYALEMNQGWFSARGIKAGEKVIGLEKVPTAN
ncbi:MAG: DUF192 domain-containing protein [Nitrosomonas sp.]|nr:DUF192 domain-containing protein [Nitrosomonas sp.]MDP1949552.1 DUF192 domain-containing protein [Nitrosomonas sp.]